MQEKEFTHFDEKGASRMVDVTGKADTVRFAKAEATVTMKKETLRMILDRKLSKGDVLEVARLAGIMAAKRTPELIPLCHPLPLGSVKVDLVPVDEERLRILSEVKVMAKTGAEMEALTAVTVAALTVYDMCKAVDRAMVLGEIRLLEKSGGKSGTFFRASEP